MIGVFQCALDNSRSCDTAGQHCRHMRLDQSQLMQQFGSVILERKPDLLALEKRLNGSRVVVCEVSECLEDASTIILIAKIQRSEERRVGKERVSTCRSRWSTYL